MSGLINDIPAYALIDDMEVQHFYDMIDRVAGEPYWMSNADTLYDQLELFARLQTTGMLDKYSPLPVRTMNGDGDMTSQERKNRMYQIMARRMINTQGKSVDEIEIELRNGMIDDYRKEVMHYMSEQMNTKADVMAYAKDRMTKGLPFSADDKLHLNMEIQKRMGKIESDLLSAQSSAYAVDAASDLTQRRYDEGAVDPTIEMPAYLSREIGIETPSDLKDRASRMLQDAQARYEMNRTDLYEDVYDLEHYSQDVNGRTTSLLQDDTRLILGADYEAYANGRFEQDLANRRAKHGLYAVNLAQDICTKPVISDKQQVHAVKEQTETKAVSKAVPDISGLQDDSDQIDGETFYEGR